MMRSQPLRPWYPRCPLDLLGALWATAVTVPPVSVGVAVAYRTVNVALRCLVVGRRVTVPADGGAITMTVSQVESRPDIRITATDITWRGSTFERASAVLCNVQVRPGAPPTVAAAPVHLTLDVPTPALDDLFLTLAPRFAGGIGEDAVGRIRLARRPGLGHVEVDAELDDTTVVVTPRALTLGGRRWPLPPRTPGCRIPLPELPRGVQVTDVHFEPGLLRLSATLPRWRTAIRW
ncbi:hypothetical protein [Mycolicibacterium mengxianglii]|uniref:hypothetical protein n=1 Tax=Mycolicibacterium mengxianglii TaxID=2736649 RepID=UPI0018D14D1F|nr:hypothetical protein [Mycolicibacterium mengxianglii]